MHIINTIDLKGDEILAKDIISATDIVLIYKGTVLKKEYRNKLIQLGVETVLVEDQISETKLSFMQAKKSDVIDTINELVKNLLEQHIYSYNNNIIELCSVAQRIISDISSEEQIYEQIINMKQETTDIYTHSVNVCVLATLMALKLNMEKSVIEDIARASLLHDIGLRYVTTTFENIEIEDLSETAQKEYKKHVIYGYAASAKINELSQLAKKIILLHHETLDGRGFPFGMKGDKIPFEAKIVGVCDAIECRKTGIGCKKTKVNEIIEYLKVYKDILYDKTIVEELLRIIAVYPLGTKVITNENEIGIVISQNKNFSERPVIMIIEDKNGEILIPPKKLDLLEVLNVYIKDVLN